MEKDDLIVPTFFISILALVWATGNPSLEDTTVTEFQSFEVDSSNLFMYEEEGLQHQYYDSKEIACSEEVVMAEVDYYGDSKVLPVARSGEVGRCDIRSEVDKTVLQLYGFEVMLW